MAKKTTEPAPVVVKEPFQPTHEWDFRVYADGAAKVMEALGETREQYITRTLESLKAELEKALI